MSNAIIREPAAVRPWETAPLRPTGPSPSSEGSADPGAAGGAGSSPEAQAEEILEQARQQAEQIVQQARAEADQLRVESQREGFADGLARGLDEWAGQREQLREMIGRVEEAYGEFCLRQVPALADLATRAAEKLLYDQLSLEPERVVTIVRQALDQVVGSTQRSIHLNPDDLELVRSELVAAAGGALGHGQAPGIQLHADPLIERGGCWIRSEHGDVDATVSGRLARLADAMNPAS